MGVEQGINQEIQRRKVGVHAGPFNIALEESSYVNLIAKLEGRIYDGIRIHFEPHAEEQLQKAVISNGYLIGFSKHESHYDGRAIGKALNKVSETVNRVLPPEEQYEGWVIPKATSIDTGDQDKTLGLTSLIITQKMEEENIYTADYTREKDQEKYHLPPNTVEFMRKMTTHARKNHGIGVFPEGTVEGGRKSLDDKGVSGMQEFEMPTLAVMARIAQSVGKTPVFFPISISGTHKILEPLRSPDESDRVTKTPTSTMLRAAIPLWPVSIVDIKIGCPILWDSIPAKTGLRKKQINEEALNLYLERELARIVPKAELGKFRNNHTR